ncbi:MAG: caspase family protein, partial [Planctomycetaceae bacterium]|nr:caspase family protein [Planctomycetaceae bacterium]
MPMESEPIRKNSATSLRRTCGKTPITTMSSNKKIQSQNKFFQKIVKDAFNGEPLSSEHPIENEDLLLRWTESLLSVEEHNELLRHLANCSDCRQEIAMMIKNDILEFQDCPVDPSVGLSRPGIVNYYKKSSHLFLLTGIMTSAFCLLFVCLTLFQGDNSNLAIIPNGSGVTFRGGADTPDKYALLVGINEYAHLKKSEWLDGCQNDIIGVKSIIIDRFGFDTKNVTTLLDGQATAAAIREQFRLLVKQIQSRPQDAPPAQVLFYFSGHGSRIADQPEDDPDCDSEDGFDSTLVVYDSEQQGSGTDIRDDELNQFAHEICNSGKAELLIALDSCHSGGGARGITKFRGIERNLERTVPVDSSNRKITPKTLPAGTVFLSACQDNQKEPEYQCEGKTYGLFSYHLTQLLNTEQIVSSLDYKTLKDAIHRSYQRNKIAQAPTPTIEGNPEALKKPILGANRSLDKKPYWEVVRNAKDGRSIRMESGKMNGITEQSLFELYETIEQAIAPNAPSLGWFAVIKVEGKYSLGGFFQWKDTQQSERIGAVLPSDFKTGFAVERFHHYGENVLAVRVIDATTGVTVAADNPNLPETVRDVLLCKKSQNESKWIRWVGTDEDCDIVIRYDTATKLAALFPAIGNAAGNPVSIKTRGSQSIPDSLLGGWGPVEWGSENGKIALDDLLRRILKVISLKRLVAEKNEPVTESTKRQGGEIASKLAMAVFRYGLESKESKPVVIDPSKGIVLEGGEDDWYQIRIKNNDAKPFYLSILLIGPDMQIQPLACGPENNPVQFDPEIGTDNNIAANKLEQEKEFVSIFGFTEPFGQHTLVVLATREPSNFSV